jgi:uncharacterized membrane protein
VTSFATIGIMWINHHRLFNLIARADHWLFVLNALLLLGVTFVPFPTAVVAEHFRDPDDGPVAAMLYAGTFTALALVFNGLWWCAAYKKRLLYPDADDRMVRAISRSYAIGPLTYLTTLFVAAVSAPASVGLNLILAVFYALPPTMAVRTVR